MPLKEVSLTAQRAESAHRALIEITPCKDLCNEYDINRKKPVTVKSRLQMKGTILSVGLPGNTPHRKKPSICSAVIEAAFPLDSFSV